MKPPDMGHPNTQEYESLLRELGLDIEPGRMDAEENYYYLATKVA